MTPVLELVPAVGRQHYILYRDPGNHEVLAVSEGYVTRRSRNRALRDLERKLKGLAVVKRNELVRMPD